MVQDKSHSAQIGANDQNPTGENFPQGLPIHFDLLLHNGFESRSSWVPESEPAFLSEGLVREAFGQRTFTSDIET
jgi:hypothetical protein